MLYEHLLNKYMIVVSLEPNSVNVSPFPTAEEFTSPKPTVVTILLRQRALLYVGPPSPYSLLSYVSWYCRFSGLNVELPHI